MVTIFGFHTTQSFSNSLLDEIIVKNSISIHSRINELNIANILDAIMRVVHFEHVYGFKVKIYIKYRKVIMDEILNPILTHTPTNTWQY